MRETTAWNTSEYSPVTNPSTASVPDTATVAPASLSGVNLQTTQQTSQQLVAKPAANREASG